MFELALLSVRLCLCSFLHIRMNLPWMQRRNDNCKDSFSRCFRCGYDGCSPSISSVDSSDPVLFGPIALPAPKSGTSEGKWNESWVTRGDRSTRRPFGRMAGRKRRGEREGGRAGPITKFARASIEMDGEEDSSLSDSQVELNRSEFEFNRGASLFFSFEF